MVHVPVDLTASAQRMSRECLEGNTHQHVVFHIQDGIVVDVGCHANASRQRFYFVKDNSAGFDAACASDHRCTGIGLANVKRVIERDGGTARR